MKRVALCGKPDKVLLPDRPLKIPIMSCDALNALQPPSTGRPEQLTEEDSNKRHVEQ